MKLCTKSGCPNRLSIGGENDVDSIPSACLKCNKLVYSSESKSKLIWLYFKLFLMFFFITTIALVLWNNSEHLIVEEDPPPILGKDSVPYTEEANTTNVLDPIDRPFNINEYRPDVLEFLKEFYRQGDNKNVNGQLNKFQFDLEKYYETDLYTEVDVLESIKIYYSKTIKSSTTKFYSDSLDYIGVDNYDKNKIDSLYEFSYPLLYEFETNTKVEKLRLRINVKLVRVNQKWKIKSIEEVERIVISTLSADSVEGIDENVIEVVKPSSKWDCPSWNKDIGDKCDDNNNNTINDLISRNCECIGETRRIETIRYYRDDIDKDEFGDPNDYKDFDTGMIVDESIWVRNSDDKCPKRGGPNTSNGCPVPVISPDRIEVFKDESFTLLPSIETIANDKFKWKAQDIIDIVSDDTKSGNFVANDYGVSEILFNISNINGYNESVSVTVLSKISKEQMENGLKDFIIPLGLYKSGQQPINLLNVAREYRDKLKRLCSTSTKISVGNSDLSNEQNTSFYDYLNSDLMGSESNVKNIRVHMVEYDLNTNKIKEIILEPNPHMN